MMAPIVPHMAEDAWQNIPYKANPAMKSVFDKGWIKENERFATYDSVKWDRIRLLRNDVNRCLGELFLMYNSSFYFMLFLLSSKITVSIIRIHDNITTLMNNNCYISINFDIMTDEIL